MNAARRALVAILLRLYPAQWRREYGPELGGILTGGELGAVAILDVIRSAIGQQLRIGEPWFLVGAPLLVLNLAVVIRNIFNPWIYADNTLQALPAQRWWFWLPVFFVGFWTVFRSLGKERGVVAAMKTSLLTSGPVPVMAVLAALGVLRIIAAGPGELAGTFSQGGIPIALYDNAHRPMNLIPFSLLPVLNLPYAALGGWLGGLLARLWLRLENA